MHLVDDFEKCLAQVFQVFLVKIVKSRTADIIPDISDGGANQSLKLKNYHTAATFDVRSAITF